MYARDKVYPKINNIDHEKIERLYSELRRESMMGGSIPITVRYLESIIRMSESFARMHLRDFVRQDDIDQAIAVTIRSFISAQKYSVKKSLSKVFDKYLAVDRDNFELLLHILSELEKEVLRYIYFKSDVMPDSVELDLDDFENRVRILFLSILSCIIDFCLKKKAHELNIHDLEPFYESFMFRRSFVLDRKARKIATSKGR
jgi:DNA replication licensing factor MCM2